MTRSGSSDFGSGVKAALVITALLALVIGTAWFTAPFWGEKDKRENTEGSGTFRQSSYEEFFDLCAAVRTDEERIDALTTELEAGSGQDRAERIRSSITAVRASRAESVHAYNSKAAQEHRAAFRDQNLPARLDTATKETACVQ